MKYNIEAKGEYNKKAFLSDFVIVNTTFETKMIFDESENPVKFNNGSGDFTIVWGE